LDTTAPYQLPRQVAAATLNAARGSWFDRLRRRLRGRALTCAKVEAALMACFDDSIRRVFHDLYFLTEATEDLRAAARVQAHAVSTLAPRLASRFGLPDAESLRLATAIVDDYAVQAAAGFVQTGPVRARLSGGLWSFERVGGVQRTKLAPG
jgi:hypothetical protein